MAGKRKKSDLVADVDTKGDGFIIQPKNEYFIAWEHFVAFVYLISICICVYLPTFDSTSAALWIICYCADAVNFIDMVVMFFVAYVDPKSGAIRDDRRSVVQYRLKTSFVLDLASMLPLELLALKFKGSGVWREAALFHLNRTIRIYKTVKIFSDQENNLTHSRMVAAFFKYMVVLVVVIQIACCVWFGEACLGKHDFTYNFVHSSSYMHHNVTPMHCAYDSWVIGALTNINANMSVVMDAYIMSLYWTFATVTAVGYGDIVANTPLEMMIAFTTMILGITVFNGLIFGGLTSMMTNDDQKRTAYTDKLNVVKATLKEMAVAEDLAKSVEAFYEYMWKERQGFLTDKNELYDSLPHSFQGEICYAINAFSLQKAPLFENVNEGFMRVLSTKIKKSLFLPHQIIVKQGDIGHEMYYIRVGSVEILGEDEDSVVAVLNAGMVFGEINLVYTAPRTATVRSATFCELLILSHEDFKSVVAHYPSVDESISALAKARYREINEQKMKKAEKKSDPHYKARQARRTSFVPPSRIRRYSFATNERDPDEIQKPQGVVLDNLELRRLEEKDEASIREYISLKKIHESSAFKQTMLALATAIKSVLLFISQYFMPFWKAFMILVSVMTAIFFPYVACFYYSDYQLPGYDPRSENGNFWLTITYMLDLCFLAHMLMLSRADFNEYCVKNRSLTKTTKKLLKEYILGREYLKYTNFRLNFMSIVPLEFLSIIQQKDSRQEWRLFGFLRLNRLLQFFLLMRHLKRLEDDIHISLGKLRSLQMSIYIIIFTHWCACALFLVHCQGVDCSDPTWYTVFLNRMNLTMSNTTQSEKIVVTLYWAVATLTSTGYGEISAVSVTGMVVSFLTMLIGIVMFGYAVALMAATLANSDSARVRFQSRLFAVRNFMKEQHLSHGLQHRIVRYMQLMWIKYKGVWMPGDEGLLDDCPAGVRNDIALEDAHKTLSKVPIFTHLDDEFLRDVALQCHNFYFFPGEDMMHAGDISNELYVIKRGYCNAWSMDMKRKLADIGPEGFFGDQALLFGDQNQFTVQADTYCDALVLETEEFDAVLNEYPDIKEQFEMARSAKEFYVKTREEIFEKQRILLHDENHLANVETEVGYTEHIENETQQDSVVSFVLGNRRKLYDSFLSRKGFAGKLVSTLMFRYALLPEGKLLHYKVHTIAVLAFIHSLTIPIQVAFLSGQTTFWFLHMVLDSLFLGNIYLNLHVGFYNENAVLVTHPYCTAKNYFRKNFIWDLISSFPFEIFVAAGYGHLNSEILHVMAMTRMNRLFNSIKVKLSFNYFESRMDKETGVLREAEFAIFTVMFINLATCIVFLTACPPRLLLSDTSSLIETAAGYKCFNDSWLVNKGIVDADPVTLYLYSAYWATATVVSVGYGDVYAYSWTEMRMAIVLMIVGVMFFAFIVASIASAMANADSGRARFQDKLNGIRTLMKDHRVNHKIRNRVVNYYTYIWRRTHGVDPSTLFDGVPHALLSDITYALYSDTIYKISLFTGADHGFVKMLSRCMRPMYFLKGEFIVRKNDIGEEMFFIDRGEVEVTNAEGTKIFATIGAGGAFGEVALLFSCRRTASVRSKTNVDVFCLAKRDLDHVLNLHPEIKKFVMDTGADRRKQAAARPLRKRETIVEVKKTEESASDKVHRKKSLFEASLEAVRKKAAQKKLEGERELEEKLKKTAEKEQKKKRPKTSKILSVLEEESNTKSKKKGKKKETPTKEAPTKKVPAKEEPTMDAPTKEAPTKKVPAKEEPTMEAPTKEAPTKKVPTKEAQTKEAPTMVVPTKEAPTKQAPPKAQQVSFVVEEDSESEEEEPDKSEKGKVAGQESADTKSAAVDLDEEEDLSATSSESEDDDQAEIDRQWYATSPDYMYGSDLDNDDDDDDEVDLNNMNNNSEARNLTNNNLNQSRNNTKEPTDPEDQGFVEFLFDPTQIIEPDSGNYQKFRLFLEGVGSILAILTIYQICFYDFSVYLIAVAYFCDIVNIIDLYIRMRVTYYDDHGILVKSHKLARIAYLKNPTGFFMDLLSVLPIELACFGFQQADRGNVWSIMRVMRLLRVFHVLHFFKDWEKELNVNVLKVRLLKFMFLTLFVMHVLSCLWFMVDCPLHHCEVHETSWFKVKGLHDGHHGKLTWYVTSLYWTMATMTTTGYGDIYAYNVYEMGFAICTMLIGKLMFGFILGNIASTLANREARMTNYRNTLTGILGRLEEQEVPLHMRQHVVAYLDYTWIRNQGHDFTQLFNDAPSCLAAEILHAVAKPFFESMILFKDLEDAFVRRMALHVHRVLYQEGDYIAHKDDLGDEVLFIFRGSVLVIEHDENDKEHDLGFIGYGTVIGECFLVHSMPRLMSLKANERTDLLTIETDACLELLEHYPSSKEIFDSHAQEYFVEAGFMTEIRV